MTKTCSAVPALVDVMQLRVRSRPAQERADSVAALGGAVYAAALRAGHAAQRRRSVAAAAGVRLQQHRPAQRPQVRSLARNSTRPHEGKAVSYCDAAYLPYLPNKHVAYTFKPEAQKYPGGGFWVRASMRACVSFDHQSYLDTV